MKTVVVVCCFVLTGCASAQILHDKQQARLYADLQQDRALLKKFRECSLRPYGEPSNAETGDAEPQEAAPAPSTRPLQMIINKSRLNSDEDVSGLLQVVADLADPRGPQRAAVLRVPDRDELVLQPFVGHQVNPAAGHRRRSGSSSPASRGRGVSRFGGSTTSMHGSLSSCLCARLLLR